MKFLATLLSLALLVVSCEEDRDSEKKDDILSGKTWSLACSKGGDFSFTASVVFNGEQLDRISMVYSDEACENQVLSIREVLDYEILGLADAETDVYNINYRSKQAYMAVFDEDFLNNYNEKKEYGYSDWEKGVAKDIINKEDLDGEVTHPLGEVTYSNYKLTADQKLYVIGKDEFSDSRDEEADKAEETRRKANDIDLNYWYE